MKMTKKERNDYLLGLVYFFIFLIAVQVVYEGVNSFRDINWCPVLTKCDFYLISMYFSHFHGPFKKREKV